MGRKEIDAVRLNISHAGLGQVFISSRRTFKITQSFASLLPVFLRGYEFSQNER